MDSPPAILVSLAPFAARALGLLELLREPLTLTQLEERGFHTRMVAPLLPVLELAGAVARQGEGWIVARPPPVGPTPGDAALIAEVIARGEPLSPEELARHPRASKFGVPNSVERASALASQAAELLAPAFRSPGWLADLGCGIGLSSLALLSVAPAARALLIDHPVAIDQASRLLARYRARVELRVADLSRPLPFFRRVRAALVSDVLHLFSAADARRIVAGAVSLLEPGGTILIVEIAPASARAGLFALSSVLLGGGLTLHGDDELRDWLAAAGCAIVDSQSRGDATFHLGRRPSAPRVDDL